MNRLPDGRWEVITEKGRIVAEHVVNAAGSYTPQLGAMVGLDVPIESVIHQYLVTERIEEVAALETEHPVVRDPRASCYYRQEHDGLIIGPYERADAKEYGVGGIDWDLTFHLTPVELDRLLPWLDLAAQRLPCFAGAGIKQVVSGPITHTPDAGYLMGPAPGLPNYWYCAGASIGITQGPGAGKYLAQWMVHGQTEINVANMDPRRFGPYAPGRYTHERSIDEFHEMYQVRMPNEYRDAGRPMKKTPLYDILDAKGARWQEVWGWERAMYFSPDPEVYSFRRSSAHDEVGAEVRAIREGVGIADLTAFAKFEVTGPDAAALLDRLSANRMPARDGGIRLVHMLTTLGGIESEMTITRLGPERFYLNSAITAQGHDFDWLTAHIPGRREGDGDRRHRPDRHPGGHRPPFPGGPGRPDRRRSLQPELPLAHRAGDRGGRRPMYRPEGLLCRRAGLGAAYAPGTHGGGVRGHPQGGRTARDRRLRQPGDERDADREGLQGRTAPS